MTPWLLGAAGIVLLVVVLVTRVGVRRGARGRSDRVAARLAREELLASEQRHRTIVEALNEGVVLQQADGQITACNARAQALLGLSVEQMLGRTSLDPRWRCVHADGTPWPGEEHPVPRALRTGTFVGPETMGIHTPDGRLRWLEVSATPIMDGDEVVEAVASFVDITERRAAESAARAVAARTSATLEGLTEGIIFHDEQLVTQAFNDAGRRMLGLTADGHADAELVGLEVLDADGTPLPHERWPAVQAHQSGTPVVAFVLGIRREGGPVRWVEVNASPLREGRTAGPWPVVSSFTDITERLSRDRALVEAEQRVRATFDAAPVGMVVARLDGTFLEVNQALADLLGLRVEALVGRRFEDVTHPDDVAEHRAGERRVLAGEVPAFRMEERFVHAAGTVVWAQMDLTVLRDADGVASGTIAQIQDVSDRRRHEDQLVYLADHDALTGLLNRRGFQRELEAHVAEVVRNGPSGALLMLDVDHFKYVNDTLGHKAGDEVIVAVADLLRSRLRRTDVVARIGGDEFAVLLPHGTGADADRAAESILRTLRERQPHLPTLGRLKLTASIGVAPIVAGTLTADELLINADLAMYDAKEGGRDQVSDFETSHADQPRIKARITWMERISGALEGDGFTLFAQPIQALDTGTVAMHELLLRMYAEDGELIGPATFLAVAERFELVQDIDRWVVDHACKLLRDSGRAGVTSALAINVSARSINDPDRLLTHIAAALERTGADPARLIVEITETAAVSQIHHARAFARDLRRLGCRLALDDFGAGFGAFAYLKHLPFDFLKIDGEFVTNARHSRPDALIVRALRDMAHGLDKQVIAEYCADAETLDFLRAEGIDYAQGYHLGRPAPAAELLLIGHGLKAGA